LADYSDLLADSMLRHKAWMAEHTARIETQLANKVKSEFIANMSHELRTPLNTVIGFSKLMGRHDMRPLSTGEIVEYADLIRDAATHLLAVINDVLDISKIQSGRYTLDAREVEIDEILLPVLSSLRQTAAESSVALLHRLEDGLPAVKGDPDKLRQAFSNLVGNAIKFTPSGGSVSVEASPDGSGGAVVRILDTGVGMSPEEIEVALTPFGQVDAGRARWRDGAGLGLPIARALVQLHGGRLEIRSVRKVGTQVTVTLPASAEVADMHGSAPAAAAAPRGAS
jgi:two-component system cell cycle sensor histidine kinase PleC